MKLIDLKKELNDGSLTGLQRMAIQQDIVKRQDRMIQKLAGWVCSEMNGYSMSDGEYIKKLLIDIETEIEKEIQ
jgi:hypothetical protein